MSEKHIINILDAGPVDRLPEAEVKRVETHAQACSSCGRAFRAARLTDELLRARTAEAVEMPPFFQTRLMAAWRERSAADQWSFARLWRNAGALVSSMAATVAVLAALTFFVPAAPSASNQTVAQATSYSAVDVIVNGNDDNVSDGQAATTILDDDDDGR